MNKTVKNVISFGASVRIDKAEEKYQKTYHAYKDLSDEYNERRENFRVIAQRYLSVQKKAQKLARRLNVFIKTSEKEGRKDIETEVGINSENLLIVKESLKGGEVALNTIKGAAGGIAAGAAVPGAMFSVAYMIGTAGTGAAISSLSGAAATNATLAWIGGGTLAAGGGGMAAGTAILTATTFGVGIAIALLAMAGFQHVSAGKKVKAIKEEEAKVVLEINRIYGELLKVNYCRARISELMKALKEAEKTFKKVYKKTYHSVFPLGFFSRMIKGTKYDQKDKEKINFLLGVTRAMLEIRDTDIMKDFEKSGLDS